MSMKKIYQEIAKKYGVSVAEVKKDMQDAIDFAYKNRNKSCFEKIKQDSIPCKGDIPTSEELLEFVLQELKNQSNTVIEDKYPLEIDVVKNLKK